MPFLSFIRKLISKKQKIGLVLSSGGAKGFAHIGALKVIEEACIPIHCIVGTSAGAVIGGLYTSGLPLKDIEDMAASLTIGDMAKLFLPTFNRGGFIDGDRVKNFLRPYLEGRKIESLKPNFACTATDILSGRRAVFKKGFLLEAIRASIAIPGIYTPLVLDDYVLVDGGVVDPLPIDIAFELGATFVIAVNVNLPHGGGKAFFNKDLELKIEEHHLKDREKTRNPIQKIMNFYEAAKDKREVIPPTMEIISSALTLLETKLLEAKLKIAGNYILVEPELPGIEIHSFRKGREIIDAGYKAMKTALPHFLINNFKCSMRRTHDNKYNSNQ